MTCGLVRQFNTNGRDEPSYAVFHYDLSWNPTRHEQRDGRVYRFGQKSAQVRSVTCYSTDNKIDGIVLDVLIKKHRKIRNSFGISVPIPANSEQIVNAIFEGPLLRTGGRADTPDQQFFDFIKDFEPEKQRLHVNWDMLPTGKSFLKRCSHSAPSALRR
jgi:hypothetical protein